MLKLSVRNLTHNKLRFSLTTFAVLLGVSFVVASFVLTDGLTKTFDTLIEEATSDVDVEVRSRDDFEEVAFATRPIDAALIDVVQGVDGVGDISAAMQSTKIVPVKPDGDPVQTMGAPILSFNWTESTMNPLTIVAGEAPDAPGEFGIDEGTADRDGFVLGETYDVIGADGREAFTLVGLTRFGNENSLAGAVLVSFSLDEIQRLDGSDGTIQWIDIAADGVEPSVLIERLDEVLPPDVEAVPGIVVVEESQDDFSGVVSIFGNVLLAFALVAVFVSTFIIGNTFNILLGQRVRQLALLRALGASSAQVRFSALLESLVVGVVASILGLGGGVLLAIGLRSLMNALGFALPSFDIVVSPRTIVIAVIVGIGVTLMASLSPARRAASVPPIAAMRAGYRFGSGEGTRRTIIAIVLSVVGVAAVGYGLVGSSGALPLLSLGLGAVLIFVSVSMYAPLFSSPSASFLGAPLEHVPGGRITGHIARQNAARNNKRTASTAAGLMIGLALIAMASVVAESMKASFTSELGSTMTGDYVITAQGDAAFSNQVASQVGALPEFADVSAVRWGNMRIDGSGTGVAGGDLTVITNLLEIDVQSGDPAASAAPGMVIISTEAADDLAVTVGDTFDVEFAASGMQTLTVGAIYDNSFLIGDYVVDLSSWDSFFDSVDDNVISARVADGVELEAAGAALEPLEEAFPQLQFETQAAWSDRLETELDSLLVIINVFLGLAIIIALLGIANTMALSVLERTREIGLMRAIGMTRRQTRTMIRLEAAIVSLFGALLGVAVGLLFGWIAVLAIPESLINQLAIPGTTLAIYVVVATIAGLLAASFPARRAARLKVLEAIAHE
ncbi:MAG TPA: FtsX-like permease family protein [Ilumatobacteraceae bacterium]|nr:FtsX-like permease family protein [Ilumatobacteraceae bacterium]